MQISGAQWTNMWGAAYYFPYNFLKFTTQSFFFSSNELYFLCIRDWIIRYINQLLLFGLGSWLVIKKGIKSDVNLGGE